MEIKIDTKKDSVDDIKKTIDFLLKFVGEDDKKAEDIPTVGEGAFNIFGESGSKIQNKKEDEDKEDSNPGITIIEY